MDENYNDCTTRSTGKGRILGLEEGIGAVCTLPPISRLVGEPAVLMDYPLRFNRLQEEEKFLLTPFERNIEVWRQLWRVLERSHLVVQIVDARNPLRFRCEDLESYVQDVEGAEGEAGTGKGLRKSLLLVNKADLLTATQR